MRRKEILLRSTLGEAHLIKCLPFLTVKDLETKKPVWCRATADYDLNPFGKLVKSQAKTNAAGKIIAHKKHHHGFFVNLKCTEEFYEKNKGGLENFHAREDQGFIAPAWL
tara:strand:- start:1676 stop:2005 length:330 start_codon:yes stop_codon:yes gene_type:complete